MAGIDPDYWHVDDILELWKAGRTMDDIVQLTIRREGGYTRETNG